MRKLVWSLVLVVAVTQASSAVRSQSQAGVWDGVYAKVAAGAFEHNAFLGRMAAGRPPGRALDIGIGEGRNAFFLASQGWDVTGFDASAAGIKLTVAEAAKRRPRVTALVADVDSFDYGTGSVGPRGGPPHARDDHHERREDRRGDEAGWRVGGRGHAVRRHGDRRRGDRVRPSAERTTACL